MVVGGHGIIIDGSLARMPPVSDHPIKSQSPFFGWWLFTRGHQKRQPRFGLRWVAIHPNQPRHRMDRWAITWSVNQLSSFFFRSSALLTRLLDSRLVKSRMLSSHRFLCPPLLVFPRAMPWRTVLASLVDLVTYQNHFNIRPFPVEMAWHSPAYGVKRWPELDGIHGDFL